MNSLHTLLRRGAVALVAAATAVAGAVTSPTPAQAQEGCLEVTFTVTNSWGGPDGGGYIVAVTITNTCPYPVAGWDLEFTLPPGHTLDQAWSAQWSVSGDQITASPLSWNAILAPGASVTIGFIGSHPGTLQEPPLSCTINGSPCAGSPNQPPEVALTSPPEGFEDFLGCDIAFAADAADPDGAVDRVEFYVNGQLVGTDDEAPYALESRPPNGPEGDYTAFARAYDDGSPARSTDSATVTFQLLPPPPGVPGVDPCRRAVPPIPPDVTLTSPADGAGIASLCPVPLAALAVDPDGAVERVEFYVNDQLVGTDHTAPYQVDVASHDPALAGGPDNTVQARAYDHDDPPQVGVSPLVTFDMLPIPPALLIVSCTPELAVPEGGSAVAVFADGCLAPSPVELTVAGDLGITVSPTSYLPAQDGFGDRVTVTAAPGTAGATATITAQGDEGCLPASATVTVTGAG